MEALPAIIGGRAGGFPGWANECFAGGRQSRGIDPAKIRYEIAPDLGHWGVEIVDKVKAWAKAISGPTSPPGKYPQLINAPGSETGPGPQLATRGKSTILSVDAHGFKFEYTLNSAKHIPFDWGGPLTDRASSLGAAPTSQPKRNRSIDDAKDLLQCAASQVPADATAFALRRNHVLVEILAMCADPAGEAAEERHRQWARATREALNEAALPGGYPNLLTGEDAERVAKSYGPNARRLMAAKRHCDPDNFFCSAIPLPTGREP